MALLKEARSISFDFKEIEYTDSRNRKHRAYELTKRAALIAMPFIGGEKAEDGQVKLVDALLGMEAKEHPLALEGPSKPITPKQYKELSRKVELIAECFHRAEAARAAAWTRLRQQLNVQVTTRNLPQVHFEAAQVLLEAMYKHAISFRSEVMAIEREFFKHVMKMGEDFNPDELQSKLKEVVGEIESRQASGMF